jgi:hypothetical protein
LVKASRIFWIFVVSGVVVLGGAAWLWARRLPAQDRPAASDESSPADPSIPGAAPGVRPRAPEAKRPSDPRPIAAGDQALAAAAPAARETPRPNGAPLMADTSKTSAAPAPEADEVDAPARRARSKEAPRVNPVSGELMWSARDVTPADGGRPDAPLCGGKACPAGQFCCGPPECGHCAYPMAGPHCPSVCPGQKSH